MSFNLDNYEDVDSRIQRFWASQIKDGQVKGRIMTDIIQTHENADGQIDQIIIKATVLDENGVIATGYAEERLTNYGVNKTSMVENCETSAIGRALANAGYSSKGARASRQEMEKVERAETVTAGSSGASYRMGAKDTRPTDKQKAYALKLLAGRDHLTEEFRKEHNITGTLDRQQTADFISWLQEHPVTVQDIVSEGHDMGGW